MLSSLSICGAIEDVGTDLSWDATALNEEVSWRAAALARMGIGRGSVVAIAHSGTARFFADLFAVWSVGAAAACLDSTLTLDEMRNVVQFADSSLLLVDGATIADISVPIIDLTRTGQRKDTSYRPMTPNLDDPALILFTSGTTGTPKGVVLSFRALLARIDANITAIGSRILSRALVTLPTFFGHGLIGNSLTPLMSGGTIILHPRGLPLINNLGAVIDRYVVSFMSSVPSMWRLALTCSPPPNGRTLARVHVGSAPLSATLWSSIANWSGAEVVNCYGITETANWIAGASSREDGIADGLVGKMWGGFAGVMDQDGSVRSHGDGQIVIKSACLTSGYLKRPDLTSAAFCQGWFQTGDYGRIDQENRIWITGRMKDEINCGGFKVQPAELDVLLETHPAVAEACVFGIPDPMGGEAVAAAIRLVKGEHVSAVQLQSWCGQRLRRAAVPEHWFFVPEIPRTSRGKVSRSEVRRILTQEAKPLTVKAEPPKPSNAVIAIAATFALDPLLPLLRFAVREAGLSFEVCNAPYHQVFVELGSTTGILPTNSGGTNVVILRLEDFVRGVDSVENARCTILKTASDFQIALTDYLRRVEISTILVILRPSPRVPKPLRADIVQATDALIAHASSLQGLTLLSSDSIDLLSSAETYNIMGDEFAHLPYTETYYASMALAIARKLVSLKQPAEEKRFDGALCDGRSLLQKYRSRQARPRTLPTRASISANETERELLEIWELIIGVEGLGVHDDYFALGGTSLMAARLFAEISRRFAVNLPLSTILKFPTVEALARLLTQEYPSHARRLIELKGGGPRCLFFIHDGEGEVLLYRNLAQRTPDDLTVIGIEPRRAPGIQLTHARIEDMAEFYITEVRKKQPHGPYFFAGMCTGGLIAYEMASQLVLQGERVDLVVLLDAATPHAPKKAGRVTKQRLGRLKQVLKLMSDGELTPAQRAKDVTAALCKKTINALIWEVSRHCKNWSVRARFSILRRVLSRNGTWPAFIPELSCRQILNAVKSGYAPKPLAIPHIVLARAKSGEGNDTPYAEIYADTALGWAEIAKNLLVIDVEGGHSSMLQEPFVNSLAEALKPYLQQQMTEAKETVVEQVPS